MLNSKLEFSKVSIDLKATDEAVLPQFSGSYLRGAFGHSLKKAFCVMSHKNCQICLVKDSCGYFQVFESLDDSKKNSGYLYKPHPYIIHPTWDFEFKKGGILNFQIIIFGDYIKYLPYFIYSFELMGKLGFGAERFKFELENITDFYSEKSIYENKTIISNSITKISIQEYANKFILENQSVFNYNLKFITPARFVQDKKDVQSLTPEILLHSMIRRYKIMNEFYGTFDKEDLNLGNLKLNEENEQEYKSWKRYSNRQKTTLKQCGIIGKYKITVTEKKLVLFLYTMQILSIGKNTTFGLGKILLEPILD